MEQNAENKTIITPVTASVGSIKDKDVAIKVSNLYKSFPVANGEVEVLKNINLSIEKGKFTVIFGPSGCGKSTLLHTILGLEKPNKGAVRVLDKDLYRNYSEDSLSKFRKYNIGMVYQQSNWIKSIDVIHNVAFPLVLLGLKYEDRIAKASEILKSVGMLDWAGYHPSELSSGQQQKVSLARALISNPPIIIADEPTGNLDYESGEALLKFLKDFNKQESRTILMVTHDLEYLRYADTAIKLFDGEVEKVFSPKLDTEEMNNIYRKFQKNAKA